MSPRRALPRARPLLTLLVTAAVAVSGVTALAAPTGAAGATDQVRPRQGGHRFTTTDAKVAVKDGPGSAHTTTLDTRLYVPDSATARTPQPAVLMTHGFGGSKMSSEITSMASFLAGHGYVVLSYTSAGFGASSGCVTLQSRTWDVKDAQQIVTKVLQAKPYVKRDRKGVLVGMVGGSYGGGIQANLAENDPRIRAIVPMRTWSDLRYSLDPNNWVAPNDPTGFTHGLAAQGVFKREWTSLFFGSGMAQPAGGAPSDGSSHGGCVQDKATPSAEALGLPCTGFHLDVCETYAKVMATGDADPSDKALLADSAATTQIAGLRVPTLLVQGQRDTLFNLNDAVTTYLELRRRHVPVKMIWNWGGHGGYDSQPGECDVSGGGTTGLEDCYLSLRTLAFFDQYLRGVPDRSPGFTWFRDWVSYKGKGATTQYGAAPEFPTGQPFTLTMSGTGDLVVQHFVTGEVQVVNPGGTAPLSYSETSNFTGPRSAPALGGAQPVDPPQTSVAFTSGPVREPLTVVGVPSMRVRMTHQARTDLILFAKLYDVDEKGTATLVNRLVAPFRVPTTQLTPWVDVKLLGLAHRFEVGHQVQLVLSATDATSYNNPQPDVVAITTGLGSFLTLPIVPG